MLQGGGHAVLSLIITKNTEVDILLEILYFTECDYINIHLKYVGGKANFRCHKILNTNVGPFALFLYDTFHLIGYQMGRLKCDQVSDCLIP